MVRLALAFITGLALFAVAGLQQPAGTLHTGKAFRFNKVKPGVYHAVGTGALAVVGNSSIIINDNDVIVVDDHVSPAAASVLLDELKDITTKPVRTVINQASQAELKPTPPNVTLQTRMTLIRGDREIQIRFLGRAHTAGDVVVFLPRERVVITGDMLTAALSNMSDAFVNEWPATLDELKKLDFETRSEERRVG